jgi:hypothetical protein
MMTLSPSPSSVRYTVWIAVGGFFDAQFFFFFRFPVYHFFFSVPSFARVPQSIGRTYFFFFESFVPSEPETFIHICAANESLREHRSRGRRPHRGYDARYRVARGLVARARACPETSQNRGSPAYHDFSVLAATRQKYWTSGKAPVITPQRGVPEPFPRSLVFFFFHIENETLRFFLHFFALFFFFRFYIHLLIFVNPWLTVVRVRTIVGLNIAIPSEVYIIKRRITMFNNMAFITSHQNCPIMCVCLC